MLRGQFVVIVSFHPSNRPNDPEIMAFGPFNGEEKAVNWTKKEIPKLPEPPKVKEVNIVELNMYAN